MRKRGVPFTEEQLRGAAEEVRRAMLAGQPSPEACRREFSPAFEGKMDALLRRERRRTRRRQVWQRAACVLLALLLGGSLWLAVDQKARAGFLSWVRESYERSVSLLFRGEETDLRYPRCRLEWVPEGCTVRYPAYTGETEYSAVLTPDDGGEDTLFGCVAREGEWTLSLDYGENYTVRTVEVSGGTGELYLCQDGSGPNSLVWQQEDGQLICYLTGYLSGEEMLRVAEGVTLYGFPDSRD